MNRKFAANAMSDTGKVRKGNEDSVFKAEDRGLFVVADGMGGGAEGEKASKWVCEEFAKAGTIEEMNTALERANSKVYEYAKENRFKMMGSTVVAMKLGENEGVIMWAGDSRAYRLRDGKVEQLTRDHTLGNELKKVATGQMAKDLATRKHPLAHMLTKAIGTAEELKFEKTRFTLNAGDRFLMCTDGVHDLLSDEEIGAMLDKGKTREAAMAAIKAKVEELGAHDNFTMIVVDVEG